VSVLPYLFRGSVGHNGSMLAAWIFLAFSVMAGIFILNAYRPSRRNRVLFAPSFFASWLTIELAWLHILTEIVGVAIFINLDVLEHPTGWIALAICAVNLVALVVIVVRSRSTTRLAFAALGEIDDAPVKIEKGSIRRIRNLTFRRVAGRELKLDVTPPTEPPREGELRPAILQVHGGAWVIGDKREQGLPLLKYLASHGWVGFNVNYRLSPAATFPDHLIDLKAALVWIRAHADDYGIDPDFVVVTGGSAGGHLTALMALTANDPEYQPGFEEADTSVQAAVPFYGVYDFTNRDGTSAPELRNWMLEPLIMKAFFDDEPELFHRASPLDRIHAQAPPFLIIHGDKDTLAPVSDARRFAQELRQTSESEVLYIELHGAQHAFDVFGSPRTRRMVQAVERFLFAVHDAY
jgi:acetyl esterase/lipase